MPTPRKAAAKTARVTMRELARLAGVSAQAVSLALRNHPSIAAATRARIQKVAEKAGYRPDPYVTKLMHHLRVERGQRASANVCALTTQAATVTDVFSDLLLGGARKAAQAAGFAFEVIHVDTTEASRRRLQRVLQYRGVEGLMLVSMSDLRPLDNLVDWREFSVVSTTLSVISPHFHCAIPSHFRNTLQLCERLAAAGFRQPGLVIRPKQDQRCGHNFTAALAWHGVYGGGEPVRAHLCEQLEPAPFLLWLAEERPDVLVAERDDLARTLREQRGVPRSLPIVSCSVLPLADGTQPFAGIYEDPPRIGVAAIEALSRMITGGKRGVPEHPQMTLIEGTWVGSVPVAAKR